MRTLMIAICGVMLIGGCVSAPSADKWKLTNPLSKKEKEPEPYPTPVKLATTWSPDTLSAPGKKTTRGFGGRLFFYNEKSRAVPVEGELMIVGYLDPGFEGATPITRRFAFTSEQLTSHHSQTDLGASYSIWVPWDAVGGMQQKITLVPTFTPKEGNPIQGAPTVVVLPGESAMDLAMKKMPNSRQIHSPTRRDVLPQGIRQAGFQPTTSYSPAMGTTPYSGVTTTTIPLGNDMQRRLR